MGVLTSRHRLLIAIILGIGVAASLFVDFKIYPNKRLRTTALIKLTLGSLPACSRKCFETSECLSYGFTSTHKDGLWNCDLNSENSQTNDLVEEAGYVYGEGVFTPVREKPGNDPDVKNVSEEPYQQVKSDAPGDDPVIGDVSTDGKEYSGHLNTTYMISKKNGEANISTSAFVPESVDTTTVANKLTPHDDTANNDIVSQGTDDAETVSKTEWNGHTTKTGIASDRGAKSNDITQVDFLNLVKNVSTTTEGNTNASTYAAVPDETKTVSPLSSGIAQTTLEGTCSVCIRLAVSK
jgi:hypothetical protein